MENPSPGAMPRIGVLKAKDLACFMYFELIFIILELYMKNIHFLPS